jgi:hypothetical protein
MTTETLSVSKTSGTTSPKNTPVLPGAAVRRRSLGSKAKRESLARICQQHTQVIPLDLGDKDVSDAVGCSNRSSANL